MRFVKIWGNRILGRENIKWEGFEIDKILVGVISGKSFIVGVSG